MDELNQLYDQLRKAEKMADGGDQEAAADAKAIFSEIQRLEASKPAEQTSTEKPGVAATIGNALGISGLPVDAAGATIGALTGAAVKPSAVTEMVDPIVHTAIKPFPAMPEPKGPVQKYVEGTGDTPYAGGKTYSSGYKKSSIAAGEPVQSRGSKIPIRKGNLGIGNQLDPIDRIKNYAATPAQPMGRLGSSLKLGVAGELTGKTIEDIKAGKYGQAGLDALQAIGAAAGTSSYKPARVVGNLIAGKEILGGLAPFFGSNEQQPEGKAAGGSIQGYQAGSKVISSLAKKFGYGAEKVAKEYPDVLPPSLKMDPKKGTEYLGKENSPEALAVQKARKAAQMEIAKGQYSPFFDISKRDYVDPSQYVLPHRTSEVIMPKKADTIAKYEAIANDPAGLAKWSQAYDVGSQRPMAKDWYAMKQLQDEFIKELGPEEGIKQFKARFADPMGATTGGADPTSNLMTTAYTNFMRNKGAGLPENTYDLPFPIGGRYVAGNIDQARKFHDVGTLTVDTPKRYNFSSNFLGHRDRPTLDEQMMSAFIDPKTKKPFGSPPGDSYGIFERQLNRLAKEKGVDPVNFQDVTWAGLKDYQGKPMIQEINEMLHRTSRIGDISQEEALKGFIRADRPMYGIAGIGAAGAASEDESNIGYAEGGLAHLSNGGMPDVGFDVQPMVARENPFVPRNAGMPMNVPLGAMAKMKFEKELEDAKLRAAISGQGMVLPNQPSVKVMPGAMEFGANIPVGKGNVDIGAYRSLASVPGRGYPQGINVNYSTKFKKGGLV